MDEFKPDPTSPMTGPLSVVSDAGLNAHDGFAEQSSSSASANAGLSSASAAAAGMSSPAAPHHSTSRRPQRKSTLTQQQKNQKRQRATQEQLITLELEFNKNPTPSGPVRERIADEINMTERSVQIWFQNRRAKIKNIARRSIENGEDCIDIPDSMKRYLAIHGYDPNNTMTGDLDGIRPNPFWLNTETNSSKIVIQHLACRSLTIGTWRRICQNSMDLVIFYCPDKRTLTYYINSDSAGYKIEYPFSSIQSISLSTSDSSQAEGATQEHDGLVVVLNKPPQFYMDSAGNGGFFECNDFTEDHQASHILTHRLGGHPKALSSQLAKMVSLESFLKRHESVEPIIMTVSAPVSPIEGRPSSQSGFVSVGPNGESSYGPGLQPPRGHKRQRSRSVPVNADFIRNQMPSFLVQPQFRPGVQPSSSQVLAPSLPGHGLLMPMPSTEMGFASPPPGFPGFPAVTGGPFYHSGMQVSQPIPDEAGLISAPLDYGFPQGPNGYVSQPSAEGAHPYLQSPVLDDVHDVAARFGAGFGISQLPHSAMTQYDGSMPPPITSPNAPSLANTGSPTDLPMPLPQHGALSMNMQPLANIRTVHSQAPMTGSIQQSPFTPFPPAPVALNPIIAAQSPPMMGGNGDIFQVPEGARLPSSIAPDPSAELVDHKLGDDGMTPFPSYDSTMEIDYVHSSGLPDGMHHFDMGYDGMGMAMGLGVSSVHPNPVFWTTGMEMTSDAPTASTVQGATI